MKGSCDVDVDVKYIMKVVKLETYVSSDMTISQFPFLQVLIMHLSPCRPTHHTVRRCPGFPICAQHPSVATRAVPLQSALNWRDRRLRITIFVRRYPMISVYSCRRIS